MILELKWTVTCRETGGAGGREDRWKREKKEKGGMDGRKKKGVMALQIDLLILVNGEPRKVRCVSARGEAQGLI